MKVMYQAPEVKVIRFDVEGRIMGDIPNDNLTGDIFENPWQDEASASDTAVIGN